MKINAVIENKDGGTLVLDFPRSIYDVYEKIQSVGIRKSPHQITLSDEEGNDVRVKLWYSLYPWRSPVRACSRRGAGSKRAEDVRLKRSRKRSEMA